MKQENLIFDNQYDEEKQKIYRQKAIENGAILTDQKNIYLSSDSIFGKNVIIEPFVVIGKNVTIGDNVVIKSFSYIEGAEIKTNSQIGPFARIRPDSIIDENVKIGNFVEVKNSHINKNSKASHLSYIGDSSIGKNVNIGAGAITCNYDGKQKHITNIGDNVFIGSNATIIAPINIGNNSFVAAASFINKNIEENQLAVGRAKQQNKKMRR